LARETVGIAVFFFQNRELQPVSNGSNERARSKITVERQRVFISGGGEVVLKRASREEHLANPECAS